MRLWHKDLIPVLPRQQLLGQWRECCLIAKNIAENGTPNHILVNKIMNYPLEHFYQYCIDIEEEMDSRGYNANLGKIYDQLLKIVDKSFFLPWYEYVKPFSNEMFSTWHTNKYLTQCFYNLQEKYDCGGIPYDEWALVLKMYLDRQEQANKYLERVLLDT